MNVLIVNPIIYTSETADIKRADSIKDTMIYDLCLAFFKKGHSVTLFAAEPFKPVKDEEYPFEVIWAECAVKKIFKPNVFPFCPELKKVIKENRFELIISSEVFSVNSLRLALTSKHNTVIWHELAKHNRLFHYIPSKIWYGIIARLFFRSIPVIPRSNEAKSFISRFCKNVSNTVIDHGVNLDKFEACCEKDKYFIVASQLIERKQIDKIIDKFSAFSKTHDDYKLYIFGDGDEEYKLKEQVKSLKLEDKVLFFGKASHNTLKDYLSKAGALLVYTRKDNNMVSIVESIACATPVITTSVPYNASYIKENALGIVSDSWDENDLENIIENSQFINNCLSYRQTLSTEKRVDDFISEAKR